MAEHHTSVARGRNEAGAVIWAVECTCGWHSPWGLSSAGLMAVQDKHIGQAGNAEAIADFLVWVGENHGVWLCWDLPYVESLTKDEQADLIQKYISREQT